MSSIEDRSSTIRDTAIKLASAGTAACIADLFTYPLDTTKVRLQLQGESIVTAPSTNGLLLRGTNGIVVSPECTLKYRGTLGTMITIAQQEGPKTLYNGLAAGLQRQMCFASIRIGLYDDVKSMYFDALTGAKTSGNASAGQVFIVRLMAGITTGACAVLIAQPTDVVKVRLQAQSNMKSGVQSLRYTGTLNAYQTIGRQEGVKGLWKGLIPNVMRNSVVNVAEIVCYDIIKDFILTRKLMNDTIFCHFASAVCSGFCTTVIASPIDVLKTRFMNSKPNQYSGLGDCAVKMFREAGVYAFYKGFVPNFYRFVSWNICMWISYEQIKRIVIERRKQSPY